MSAWIVGDTELSGMQQQSGEQALQGKDVGVFAVLLCTAVYGDKLSLIPNGISNPGADVHETQPWPR
jgi:hypothetical protein